MKPSKIEKERIAFVKKHLRRASIQWKYRNEAYKNARVDRGKYKCGTCQKVFNCKKVQLDHRDPVIDIREGFTTLDNYIQRLLPPLDGWDVLCLLCHENKTFCENQMREFYKQKRKGIEKTKKKK